MPDLLPHPGAPRGDTRSNQGELVGDEYERSTTIWVDALHRDGYALRRGSVGSSPASSNQVPREGFPVFLCWPADLDSWGSSTSVEEVEDMSMTDPVADMLTRLRNANQALHDKVDIPSSKLKLEIAKILKEEGFLKNFKLIEDKKQGLLRIYMKYGPGNKRILTSLERVSRPGLRVYAKRKGSSRPERGLGITILSTSRGVMTNKKAEELGVGGEVLCYIQ